MAITGKHIDAARKRVEDNVASKIEWKITDGHGRELPEDWINENLVRYKDFETAAPLINPRWQRQHLYKQFRYKRVDLDYIIIFHSKEFFYGRHDNDNKKYFIHDKEIERLTDEYRKAPKRKYPLCPYCERQLRYCEPKPCPDRQQRLLSPEEVTRRITARTKKRSEFIAFANRRSKKGKAKRL